MNPLARESTRRIIAALNVAVLVLDVVLVRRAFASMPRGMLNLTTLEVLALGWTNWPWLLFAVSWWRSEGWRELAREFPNSAAGEAWYFAGLNVLCAMALLPYALAGTNKDDWLTFFILPMLQGMAFTGLTFLIRLLRGMSR
jgi:hypothetical protein